MLFAIFEVKIQCCGLCVCIRICMFVCMSTLCTSCSFHISIFVMCLVSSDLVDSLIFHMYIHDRARQWDLNKSFAMLENTLKFRSEVGLLSLLLLHVILL